MVRTRRCAGPRSHAQRLVHPRRRAALLRVRVLKEKRKARVADSLIAQSCLDQSTPLLTRDKDFRNFARAVGLPLLERVASSPGAPPHPYAPFGTPTHLSAPPHYTVTVDATPLLTEVARQVHEARLDAVLIGNAAAALQGAPVTTVDFDFFFRKTARNLAKLKAIARGLEATILRPFYPASELYRISRDRDGLQVDFMGAIHGVRSFEGLRDRSSSIEIGGIPLRVASLDDIIRSKRAAKRPRDRAVLEILEKAREEAGKPQKSPRHGPLRE